MLILRMLLLAPAHVREEVPAAWRGPGQPTVGCTAMPQAEMESLQAWLDPSRGPLLVQLPVQQYQRLRKRCRLPALKGASA